MRSLIAFLALIFLPTAGFSAANVPPSFADLVEKLSPAVVNISTTQKIKTAGGPGMQMFGELPPGPEFDQFRQLFQQFNGAQVPQEREVTSLGSGFIIDSTGFIITNNHVIDQAEQVTVRLSDDSKYEAKIIGRDKKTDLALLKVKADKPLPFVPFGDSDKARVGDWVIAIGNPYGLGGSVSAGIVSARQRNINAGPFDDFIQTDAAINRGNSGGPLFNEDGQVIGINSAIFSPNGGSIGIGFSIPSNLAKPIIDQLKQYGRTHRGWLGVKIQTVNDEVANSLGLNKAAGALVADVTKDGPAEKAGLKSGDVIITYDGKELNEMRQLSRLVAETKIGETVDLVYIRGNKNQQTKVKVGELKEGEDGDMVAEKEDKKPEGTSTVLGLSVTPLDANDRKTLKLSPKAGGLVITDVAKSSAASSRGLRTGDVITEVNSQPVASTEGLKKAVDEAKKSGRAFVMVTILRQGETAFVTLPLK